MEKLWSMHPSSKASCSVRVRLKAISWRSFAYFSSSSDSSPSSSCSRGFTFTMWGCCGLCFWHKPPELAHSFLFCSCVCFCLHGPLNSISLHKFSPQLSAFSLRSSGHSSALLFLSAIHLFMKVSFIPDIILCSWLGFKHQITNFFFFFSSSSFSSCFLIRHLRKADECKQGVTAHKPKMSPWARSQPPKGRKGHYRLSPSIQFLLTYATADTWL